MKAKLISLLLAGAAAVTVPACTGTTHGYVVASYNPPPPALQEEVVYYRPGYVWIHGNWVHDHYAGWRWRSGYYVRERPGYVYQDGYWDRRGRNYVYVQGAWRPRGNVVIRDHRRY